MTVNLPLTLLQPQPRSKSKPKTKPKPKPNIYGFIQLHPGPKIRYPRKLNPNLAPILSHPPTPSPSPPIPRPLSQIQTYLSLTLQPNNIPLQHHQSLPISDTIRSIQRKVYIQQTCEQYIEAFENQILYSKYPQMNQLWQMISNRNRLIQNDIMSGKLTGKFLETVGGHQRWGLSLLAPAKKESKVEIPRQSREKVRETRYKDIDSFSELLMTQSMNPKTYSNTIEVISQRPNRPIPNIQRVSISVIPFDREQLISKRRLQSISVNPSSKSQVSSRKEEGKEYSFRLPRVKR